MRWPWQKETRRAEDPATGEPIPTSKKHVLEGKLTYIGLGLTAAGAIGKMFGFDLPTEEVRGFFDWLLANWDSLANGLGILMAAYGRLRINWRHDTP